MLLAGLDFTSNPNNSKKNTIITSQVIDNKVVIKILYLFLIIFPTIFPNLNL